MLAQDIKLFVHPRAQQLLPDLCAHWARQFHLSGASSPPIDQDAFCLWHDGDQLQLLAPGAKQGVWLAADAVRSQHRSGSGQARDRGQNLLHKACALTRGETLLDAMAGWGSDGLQLASSGVRLLQVERMPLIFALLQDLHRRLGRNPLSLDLVCGDAWELLQQASEVGSKSTVGREPIDVVYLDPMFELRNKGALPTKPMQFLRQLTAHDEPHEHEIADWVALALRCATRRVVVKRRAKDPVALQPDWQIQGRRVRYDVYAAR